ncbi:MAG: iron-sulfur cluster insertion protein ErpA [Chloroflexota bacterium]
MALAEQNVETQTQEIQMTVTPSAVAVIKNLLQERNIPDYSLRVFVTGGGCSGMQYGMSFEENPREYDSVVRVDGVSLLVDPTSLVYLEGATIDFVDSLIGGGFRIDNPNAVSSCGCGSSFKSKDGAGEEATGGCGTCASY